MSETKPPLLPIKSKLLARRNDYPLLRKRALEALSGIGLGDIIPLVYEWEQKADGFYAQLQGSEYEKRIRAYIENLSLVMPLHALKLDIETKTKYQAELRHIFELKLFIEKSNSIIHTAKSIESATIVLPREVIKTGSESYICCNLLITRGRIFSVGSHRYRCDSITKSVPSNATSEEVIKALRDEGVCLIEIDYVNPGPKILASNWAFKDNEVKEILLETLELDRETKQKISSNHLAGVLSGAIAYSDDIADLTRYLRESYHLGISLFAEEIRQIGENLSALFLSLFPVRSRNFLDRMIVRRSVATLILNKDRTAPCPPTFFLREDVNFDLLEKNLPYILSERGGEALLSLAPGDEYHVVPQFRKRLLNEELGGEIRWKKLLVQSDQVLDTLYSDQDAHFIDGNTREKEHNNTMLIPKGTRISVFEAIILKKVALKLGNRHAALWAGYSPGRYQDRIKRLAIIRGTLGKTGELFLERIRRPRAISNDAKSTRDEAMDQEIAEVLDYVDATFIRPNTMSNSQAALKFTSYDVLKKASDRWHVDLYRSQFKDEDITYFPSVPKIVTQEVTAKFVESRKELHLIGSIFKNCLYSMHPRIIEGNIYIVFGKVEKTGRDFLCGIRFNNDSTFEIEDIRGYCNESLTNEEEESVNNAFKNAGIKKPYTDLSMTNNVAKPREPEFLEEMRLPLPGLINGNLVEDPLQP